MSRVSFRRREIIAALSLLPLLQARSFAATEYPTRPITIMVGFAAGGVQDFAARILGKYIQKLTGQTVIVENRSGASGGIAMAATAQAKPDGYTLMLAPVEILSIVPQIQYLPVDPRVLVPVAILYAFPAVLVVPASSPVNNVAELVQRAKSKGNLTYGSASVGSPQHLMGEILREKTGTNMTHVPYRGGSQMTTDLVAGRVDFAFSTYGSIQGHLNSLKVLAVATPARWSALPSVPTMREEGFPGFEMQSQVALMAPKGTAADLVRQIAAVFLKAVEDPDLVQEIKNQGIVVDRRNAPEVAKIIDDTRTASRKQLQSIGILL